MLHFSKSVPMKNKLIYSTSWMAWDGGVHFHQMFIFGWTIPYMLLCKTQTTVYPFWKPQCTGLRKYMEIWQQASVKALQTRVKCAGGQCHVKTVCSICLKTAIRRQTMWGSCVKWFKWIHWGWQSQVPNINANTVYIGLSRWTNRWNLILTRKTKESITLPSG